MKTDDKTDKKNKKKPTSLESAPSSGAKVPQGQDCETLICGACKAVVEEFSTFLSMTCDSFVTDFRFRNL